MPNTMNTRAARQATMLITAWVLADIAVRFAIDPLAIQHDQAFYVECGRRIAAGELPYRDFFDINPPLIMYLNAVPAFVARIVGVNPIPVFNVGLALLSGWSAWAALRQARPLLQDSFLERLVLLVVPLGPCALTFAEIDVGQREHLFLLLYYPFFILRVARWNGGVAATPASAFMYGVAAAAGVCIKPYFAVPALCVEAVLFVRARTWRPLLAPEALGAVAFASFYALHFLLWPAVMREAFFHRILPLVQHGYSAYNEAPSVYMPRILDTLARASVLTGLALLTGKYSLRVLVWPAAAFTAGCLWAVALQHKGWAYHYLPADAGTLLLIALAIASVKARTAVWSVQAERAWTTAAVTLIIALLFVWPARHTAWWKDNPLYSFRVTLDKYSRPGDGVIVMTTSIVHAHPSVLQTGRHFASRHLSALMLALALHAEARGYDAARVEEQRFLDDTAADIERNRPRAVFLDDSAFCHGCPPGFRASGYFFRDAGVRRALGGYLYRGVDRGFAVFTRPD